jgi:hypothetical protein
MKYSLIIHANGPDPKDYNVYLTDVSDYDESGNWWRLGLLQNIHFVASATNAVSKLDGGFIGLTVKECEKPDMSSGINVFLSNFTLIGNDEKFSLPNVYIRQNENILGFIQDIEFDVDVNGSAKLCISAMDGMVEWDKDIPDWVELNLVKFDWQKDANG